MHKNRSLPFDAIATAHFLGLRYVSDSSTGIRRRGIGKGFQYVSAEGTIIEDRHCLKRFRSLVIPPAWEEVWICTSQSGHLQATGRDKRGRKQYRYHALYRKVRNETKFSRMAAFASALPAIREKVKRDLASLALSRTQVLATVVSLLEATGIRVGNEEYAEQNHSFGLTTLRTNQVKIAAQKLRFRFKGKSGQLHDISLTNRRLARIVRRCQHLPGQDLFEYLDETNAPCAVCSEEVNEYVREIKSDDFTAKDFRTGIGTAEAVIALEQIGPAATATQAKKNIVAAVKTVAAKLGNRAATCRALLHSSLAGLDAVRMMFWAAIINGALAPPLILLVILLTSNRRVMGAQVSPPLLRILGWITFVIMSAAIVGMLVS